MSLTKTEPSGPSATSSHADGSGSTGNDRSRTSFPESASNSTSALSGFCPLTNPSMCSIARVHAHSRRFPASTRMPSTPRSPSRPEATKSDAVSSFATRTIFRFRMLLTKKEPVFESKAIPSGTSPFSGMRNATVLFETFSSPSFFIRPTTLPKPSLPRRDAKSFSPSTSNRTRRAASVSSVFTASAVLPVNAWPHATL